MRVFRATEPACRSSRMGAGQQFTSTLRGGGSSHGPIDLRTRRKWHLTLDGDHPRRNCATSAKRGPSARRQTLMSKCKYAKHATPNAEAMTSRMAATFTGVKRKTIEKHRAGKCSCNPLSKDKR